MLPDGLQHPQSQQPITFEKVLLVEGMDAFQFFKALLRHLNLLSEIEIRNFGGIDQLDYMPMHIAQVDFLSTRSL